MKPLVTPCQKLGYEVGDLFLVYSRPDEGTGLAPFDPGSIVQLVRDDGTDIPLFKLLFGTVRPSLVGNPAYYAQLANVEKLT